MSNLAEAMVDKTKAADNSPGTDGIGEIEYQSQEDQSLSLKINIFCQSFDFFAISTSFK